LGKICWLLAQLGSSSDPSSQQIFPKEQLENSSILLGESVFERRVLAHMPWRLMALMLIQLLRNLPNMAAF
jgi:hypothetical protein